MATYSISNCPTERTIIFVGNVRLRNFSETDPRYLSNPATLEMLLDVIAEESYLNTLFQDMRLTLRILSPEGARFVEHSGRNNYERALTSERGDSLRISEREVNLLSGPLNGKTYYIGIGGVAADATLQFEAFIETNYIRANTSSCVVTVADLQAGESLGGYLS
jgi:hypothetical protein